MFVCLLKHEITSKDQNMTSNRQTNCNPQSPQSESLWPDPGGD